MAKTYLNYEIQGDRIRFFFSRKGMFSSKKKATIEEVESLKIYNQSLNKISKYSLNSLLNLADNLLIEEKDDFFIDQKELLDIEDDTRTFENIIEDLGLPRINVQLDLKEDGVATDDKFKINTSFVYSDGRVCFAKRQGIFLIQEGRPISTISKEMFLICEQVDDINQSETRDTNFKGLACFQELLGENSDNIIFSDYLTNTRIIHASKFTLNISTTPEGFDFSPVLLQADSNENEEKNLLPPIQQKYFAEELFIKRGARSTYLLKDKSFLYIDKNLQKALALAHQIKNADKETKRDFVRNPRSFINSLLSDNSEQDDFADVLEFLFVETPSYSERVEDIGVWEPPKLPWIKIDGQKWIPNEEDLYVQHDDQFIIVNPTEITNLEGKIEVALQEGEKTIKHNGIEISVTPELLDKIKKPIPVKKPDGNIDDSLPKEVSNTKKGEKIVLFVKENFEKIRFGNYLKEERKSSDNNVPANLKSTLKPHQYSGLNWLQKSWLSGVTGALLADDMGLGKTFQVLAFLSWVKEFNRKPILIVAPTSLLRNWEEESERHLRSPFLGNLVRLYGSDLRYLKLRKEKETEIGRPTLDLHEIKQADWVVTSYETMRDYEHSLGAIPFSNIVFDEMQKLKNPKSLVTKAAKTMNSEFIVGLTGTPVENRLADLHTLADILRPGFLGSLEEFSKKYENKNNQEKLLLELKAKLETEAQNIPKLMLRRMKKDVLNDGTLKEKRILIEKEVMPSRQQFSYDGVIAKYNDSEDKKSMFAALQGLRAVSLCYEDPSTSDATINQLFDNSARLKTTLKILRDIKHKEEKAIIFVESRKIQTELQTVLQETFNVKPYIINGQTHVKKRQEYVNNFEEKPDGFDVIILSPKAAGTGFTLVAANHVIHLSRWWNPAIEDQATDRAYRIGQKREVRVYYPLAVHPGYGEGSFDIKLDNLIQKKRDLSERLLLPIDPLNDIFEGLDEVESLYFNTFKATKEETINASELFKKVNDDTDFEDCIAGMLKNMGYKAFKTQKSHDKGVDVIAEGNGQFLLIQCKFVHDDEGICNQDAVKELLDSRGQYKENGEVRLIAITNGKDFRDSIKYRAQENNVEIFNKDNLSNFVVKYSDAGKNSAAA